METDRRSLTDVYFLNVKYLLILLVVSANAIEPIIPRSGFANALYESIYLFHIPMFVMVMGYLAKGSRWDRKGLAFFRTIAWQYLLFQTVYSLVDMFYFHAKGVVYSFFMPYSLLWFLFSHWIWRAMLLGFKNIPHPVFVSVLLGIAVGYLPWTGGWLSFSRTFVFFPFFLAGYYFPVEAKWKEWMRRWRVAAALAGLAMLAFLAAGFRLNPGWLYGNMTFGELRHPEWYAGLYRLGVYALEAAASLVFLMLVPWRRGVMTEWGKRTVYVYLFQGLAIKACIAAGLYRYLASPWETVLLLAAGFGLTWSLSQRWWESFAKPWVEPDFSFIKFSVKKTP
ncbi:hypothetical protein LJK87_21455 [Paenibacillus sp. P25]|nr:hypothetical protein LJK87_21455 [Paenibacillus sp. P25]